MPLSSRFLVAIAFLAFHSARALLLFVVPLSSAPATTYQLATGELMGETRTIPARGSDTLMDIARAHGIGHRAIRLANPDVDIWNPGEGTGVLIPAQHLLPDAPRKGIVLNRAEMRLYYFHSDPLNGEPLVSTFPVGIGRTDRQTPLGSGKVTIKVQNPAWYPTANVRADYAARGRTLPLMVPPGPKNPLGDWAMVLDIPGFLIHGTNRPDGVGMRVSQGCVRLYPEDIEQLVHQVPLGTAVSIVDQPIKVALVEGQLLVEVHPPVYPPNGPQEASMEQRLLHRIIYLLERRGNELEGGIDWERVTEVVQRADGIPTPVSVPLVAGSP